MADPITSWCILRTSGPKTLPLMRSLAGAGLGAWTPLEQRTRRVGRSRERRRTEGAFTPTYVFVPAVHLPELRRLENLPANGHPDFSIFRRRDGFVVLEETAMATLRDAEADSSRRMDAAAARERRKAKPTGTPFRAGDTIQPTSGPFAGLSGVVEESNGRHTLVMFGMVLPVTIETSTLRQDRVATISAA